MSDQEKKWEEEAKECFNKLNDTCNQGSYFYYVEGYLQACKVRQEEIKTKQPKYAEVMAWWDRCTTRIREGDTSSTPRDGFEMLISWYEEEIERLKRTLEKIINSNEATRMQNIAAVALGLLEEDAK